MSLLGLDVGTTGAKAIVFDHEGHILAQAYREYPIINPQPGWMELGPGVVWEAVASCIRQVASPDIEALAVSSQGETVTAIAADGQPLGNSIANLDTRTLPQVKRLSEQVGAQPIYQVTGMPLHTMYTLSKLMWWRENRPDLFRQARRFLCFSDYVLHKLGLQPTIDYSLAARTMLLDVHQKKWSAELLELAGVDEAMLSTAAPAGTAVGEIPPKIARGLGLPKGVVAVVGGHDQPCGALGAGVVEEGEAMYAIGTVECIALALGTFAPTLSQAGFCCYPHVVPPLFITLAFNFTGGSLLRWYRDTFGAEEQAEAARTGADVYDLITNGIPQEPTDLYLLPYFVGTGTPWMDNTARGAILGLTLETTKKEFIKALLEGVTYEMALNLRYLERAGVVAERLRAIGGGARSQAWLQLKADITGRPVVTLDVSEAACLGAAILAGVGIGVYPSPKAATKAMVKLERAFSPNPDRNAIYRKKLETYERIYPALKSIGI